MASPTFLGVGAMKAGTTSLHSYLVLHPDIFIPSKKELNWFNSKLITLEEYENNFPKAFPVRGEISPGYDIFLKEISRLYPEIKLIYCVRHPVKRFISALKTLRLNEPNRKVFFDVDHMIENKIIIAETDYRTVILQALTCMFPLHIINFDDIVENQQSVWDGVCDFLEVPHFDPETYIHRHKSNGLYPEIFLTNEQERRLEEYYQPSIDFLAEHFGITMRL